MWYVLVMGAVVIGGIAAGVEVFNQLGPIAWAVIVPYIAWAFYAPFSSDGPRLIGGVLLTLTLFVVPGVLFLTDWTNCGWLALAMFACSSMTATIGEG